MSDLRPDLVAFCRSAGFELQPWQENLIADLEKLSPEELAERFNRPRMKGMTAAEFQDLYECKWTPEAIPADLAMCNRCRRVVGSHRQKYGRECECDDEFSPARRRR